MLPVYLPGRACFNILSLKVELFHSGRALSVELFSPSCYRLDCLNPSGLLFLLPFACFLLLCSPLLQGSAFLKSGRLGHQFNWRFS